MLKISECLKINHRRIVVVFHLMIVRTHYQCWFRCTIFFFHSHVLFLRNVNGVLIENNKINMEWSLMRSVAKISIFHTQITHNRKLIEKRQTFRFFVASISNLPWNTLMIFYLHSRNSHLIQLSSRSVRLSEHLHGTDADLEDFTYSSEC